MNEADILKYNFQLFKDRNKSTPFEMYYEAYLYICANSSYFATTNNNFNSSPSLCTTPSSYSQMSRSGYLGRDDSPLTIDAAIDAEGDTMPVQVTQNDDGEDCPDTWCGNKGPCVQEFERRMSAGSSDRSNGSKNDGVPMMGVRKWVVPTGSLHQPIHIDNSGGIIDTTRNHIPKRRRPGSSGINEEMTEIRKGITDITEVFSLCVGQLGRMTKAMEERNKIDREEMEERNKKT